MKDVSVSQQEQTVGSKNPDLKGRLGTFDITLATLAYAGPLTGVVGYITFIIAYGNGLGAPAAFIPVTIAFLIFAVGFGAMTRYIKNPGAFYAYVTAGFGRSAGLGSAQSNRGTLKAACQDLY